MVKKENGTETNFRANDRRNYLDMLLFENPIFGCMLTEDLSDILVEQKALASKYLNRYVIIDCYLPKNVEAPSAMSLLLINDGQDLVQMKLSTILNSLIASAQIKPLLCVGIHAADRKNEYGTANVLDYEGRGAKSEAYQQFILEELLPFMHIQYAVEHFQGKAFCGFSLGGLSAMDTVWNHPGVFSAVGVFSGSFWWRSKSLEDNYNDDTDRILHQKIRNGKYDPGLRFYFTTGSLDETADRNNNGIIDSIDDTLALIEELKDKGYPDHAIHYHNYADGRHDVATWAKALPGFLLWGWGNY